MSLIQLSFVSLSPHTASNKKHKKNPKTSPILLATAMARAIPTSLCFPKCPPAFRNPFSSGTSFPPASLFSSVKFCRIARRYHEMTCMATSAAGNPQLDGDESPYEVLGVSPIAGFDMMKAAYTRRRRDAERRGDEAYLAKLEKAYDKIMMSQLTNRKRGLTFGQFQVSKDIKYADKQPIVPWGPRFSKSSVKDMRINMAISAVFTIWIFVKHNAEWKPLQFLAFIFFYRIFEKLKAFEPAVSPTLTEDGEDEGRGLRMGKRMLRSLSLVFGCIAAASLGYTGILNLIEFLGQYIPIFLYNNQELIVTTATSIMLYIMASYYR